MLYDTIPSHVASAPIITSQFNYATHLYSTFPSHHKTKPYGSITILYYCTSSYFPWLEYSILFPSRITQIYAIALPYQRDNSITISHFTNLRYSNTWYTTPFIYFTSLVITMPYNYMTEHIYSGQLLYWILLYYALAIPNSTNQCLDKTKHMASLLHHSVTVHTNQYFSLALLLMSIRHHSSTEYYRTLPFLYDTETYATFQ